MVQLLNCGVCGHQVSSTATQCPSCGAKFKKKTSKLTWIIAAIFGLPFLAGVIGASFSDKNSTTTNQTSSSEHEPSKFASLEKFDAPETEFDSETATKVYILEQVITKNMKDPESAKFQNWHYVKASKKLPATFCGQVNAKNSFGGYTGFKHFFITTDDKMEFAIDDGSDGFANKFNKYCVMK